MEVKDDKLDEPVEAPTLSSEVEKAFKSGFKFGAIFSFHLGMILLGIMMGLVLFFGGGFPRAVESAFVWSLLLSLLIFFKFIKTNSIWRKVTLKSWQRVVIQCEIFAYLFLFVLGFAAVFFGGLAGAMQKMSQSRGCSDTSSRSE